MAHILIAETARAEIREALVQTEQQYGRAKREEYRRLITEALQTLMEFPALGQARPDIHPEARMFALSKRGQRARHLLIYRVTGDGTVEIARCVYDAMRLEPPSEW